ncbi:MAG: hypothetical protein EBR82_38480 [Caulobacteraceae bacterium]|nr:hypothetical protein [Caulobacteraceae bacterium]
MTEGIIHSENPQEHWEHLNCRDEIIIDLGCGFWTQKERELGNGTAKYFIGQNPQKYIGVDINADDIKRLSSEFPEGTFIEKVILNKEDILSLINQFNPTIIKCDIEGMETSLFAINNRHSIKKVAIETHNGTDVPCIKWMKEIGLNPYRMDSASFCPEIKIIYGKC